MPSNSDTKKGALSVRGLTVKVWNGQLNTWRVILNDVNVNFPGSKMIAIVGESGAGKSTLIRFLSGALRRMEGLKIQGSVFLDDEDFSQSDPTRWQRLVSFVDQDSTIFRRMNIEQNVMSGVVLRDRRVSLNKVEFRKRVEEALRAVGLWEGKNGFANRLHESARLISGGQRKRLATAMNLATKPPVLILDEPFTGLDENKVKDIEEMIEGLSKLGITIIFITHSLSQAYRLADMVYKVEDGKVELQPSRKK